MNAYYVIDATKQSNVRINTVSVAIVLVCSCTYSEAEDPSRSEFGINFTVLGTVITVVALLAITMVATALAIVIVAFTCKRLV